MFQATGNTVSGSAASMVTARPVPRPMPIVGMQRMPSAGIAAFNLAPQPGMGGLNPAAIPMQRNSSQAHQQQV